MKSIRLALLLGLGIWLVTFVASFVVYPLHDSERPLFESIMPVVLTAAVVVAANIYFQRTEAGSVREGLLLGAVWFSVNIIIDLPLFMAGPMGMPILDYVKDIGVTYLLIPVITTGFGFMAARTARAARWGQSR